MRGTRILFLLAFCTLLSIVVVSAYDNFTFQINTSYIAGTTFSFQGDAADLTIDWGDGSVENDSGTGIFTHGYGGDGVYNISLNGTATRISFYEGTKDALVDILTNVSPGVTGITSAKYMFRDAQNFGPTLTEPAFFDLASTNVNEMQEMFYGASNFDGNISSWDVSNVTDMTDMFSSAQNFNQDLTTWDVSNVTNMSYMFSNTHNFNGEISTWDVGNVINMSEMFSNADGFDQNLSSWNVSNVTDMTNMFSNINLSTANYDSLLIGWASLPSLQSGVPFHGGDSKYCAGVTARDTTLVGTYGWTITDGGISCDLINPTATVNFPANNFYNDTASPATVIFNCSATDNYNLASLKLYITNGQNISFAQNQTTALTGTSNTSQWSVPMTNGNYTWGCKAEDQFNNIAWSTNKTLRVNYTDITPPTVAQNTPAATYTDNTTFEKEMTFNCSATDDSSLSSIQLYMTNVENGSLSLFSSTALSGTSNSAKWTTTLATGNYTWNCLTIDSANNQDWGANRTINISDVYSPVLIQVVPPKDTVNMSIGVNPILIFNETINTYDFIDLVETNNASANVSKEITLASNTNGSMNITLEPYQFLAYNTSYTILAKVYDQAGNVANYIINEFNTTKEDTDGDGIPDDQDTDDDNDNIPDENDTITGNETNIITNVNLIIEVNDSTNLYQEYNTTLNLSINDTDRNITLLKFENDFENNTIDFYNAIIQEGTQNNIGSILIYGIRPTAKKTVMFEKKNTTTQGVCVLDAEITTLNNFSSYCDGQGETYIDCANTTTGSYTCNELNISGTTYLQVIGLTNSGVKQQCQEDWTCTSWTTCSGSQQTRTCTDNNACGTTHNQPVEVKSCTTGSSGGGSSGGMSFGGSEGIPLAPGDMPAIFNMVIKFREGAFARSFTRIEQVSITNILKTALENREYEYKTYQTTINTDMTIAEKITFDVRLENTWLEAQNIDMNSIKVIVQAGDKTKRYDLTQKSVETFFTNYEVTTMIPDYIAIVAKPLQASYAPEEPSQPITTEFPTGDVANKQEQENTDTQSEKSQLLDAEDSSNSMWIFAIIILVIVGIVGVVSIVQYNKGHHGKTTTAIGQATISPQIVFEKIYEIRKKINAEATIVLTAQMDEVKKDKLLVEQKYQEILQEEIDELQRYIDSRSLPVTQQMSYPYSPHETLFGMLARAEKAFDLGNKDLAHRYYMQAREFYPQLESQDQQHVYPALVDIFNKIK